MNKPNYVLAFDPSGNFNEGTGTTGWMVLYSPSPRTIRPIKWGALDAGTACAQEEHWDRHLALIEGLTESLGEKPVIVIEDYLLYANTSEAQINSRFETPKLIGILQHYCYKNGYEYALQTASSVKQRWSDEILAHKKYLTLQKSLSGTRTTTRVLLKTTKEDIPIVRHTLDALRHGVHYCTFKLHKKV